MDSIGPLRRIIEALKRKKYSGPASFETFTPTIQATDPYDVAMRARRAIAPLLVSSSPGMNPGLAPNST